MTSGVTSLGRPARTLRFATEKAPPQSIRERHVLHDGPSAGVRSGHSYDRVPYDGSQAILSESTSTLPVLSSVRSRIVLRVRRPFLIGTVR